MSYSYLLSEKKTSIIEKATRVCSISYFDELKLLKSEIKRAKYKLKMIF